MFSRRSRRFAQMPVRGGLISQIAPGAADPTDAVRVFLVFPQIAQIAQMPVRDASCFPTDRADLHRCPFGVFLVFPQIAQICTDAVRGAACFPHRLRRWRQGASVSFVTMLHVTCYNKVVPYCAGWALRNYIVYILYIYYIIFTPPKFRLPKEGADIRKVLIVTCNM